MLTLIGDYRYLPLLPGRTAHRSGDAGRIRHKEHVKPPTLADMEAAVQRFKGEANRREDAFKKSVEQHKSHADVLNKKFDEMLKLAKENPDEPPPKRDIDFD